MVRMKTKASETTCRGPNESNPCEIRVDRSRLSTNVCLCMRLGCGEIQYVVHIFLLCLQQSRLVSVCSDGLKHHVMPRVEVVSLTHQIYLKVHLLDTLTSLQRLSLSNIRRYYL